MVKAVEKLWMNGSLVPWDEARVHVLTHTLHYGLAVFEGIRAYTQPDGRPGIFRLREHIARLRDSAKVVGLALPYSEDDLCQACLDTLSANELKSAYIRPLAFMGAGEMGIGARNKTEVTIASWTWGSYLGDEGMAKGIRCRISSLTRVGTHMLMPKAKVSGHYVNSIMAKQEALRDGYDEALLLDGQGFVAEASGENIFIVRDGVCITPSLGTSILAGITRASLLTLLADEGVAVVERPLTRDEVYTADEVFLCGTAAEVTPVRQVDHCVIGEGARGPLTARVQKRYLDIVHGREPGFAHWITTHAAK